MLFMYSFISASYQRFSLDSYDVISDSHLCSVFSVGSHPSLEGIRCSARLRFSKRFLDRFGYHTSISWTELQLRCLPRCTDTRTHFDGFVNCRSGPGFPRHLCSRIDLGVWFPSSLENNSFTNHRYCIGPRGQCCSRRFSFYCRVSTLGDWLSDSEPGEWNEFRSGAMVGGHCCFGIHKYGMVWSRDLGGDFRRCFVRIMLVWSGQAMVGSICQWRICEMTFEFHNFSHSAGPHWTKIL